MQPNTKISNLQYELLKIYANNISDNDLLEIKNMLAQYFAKKLELSFDKFYDENKLIPEDLENWASEHNRVSS